MVGGAWKNPKIINGRALSLGLSFRFWIQTEDFFIPLHSGKHFSFSRAPPPKIIIGRALKGCPLVYP